MPARAPRRRPSATLVIACLALLVTLGGTVYAAGKISGSKFKKASIPGNRFKKDTVTGKQVKESSLGTVPSADLGNALAGEQRWKFGLAYGASQTIFTAGPFTFTAKCLQNTTSNGGAPNVDLARIVISTSENHTVFDGADDKQGANAGDFLDIATPEGERIFTENFTGTGFSNYDAESTGDGAAYADSGTAVSFNQDGVGLGENNAFANCIFNGSALVETR